MKEKQCELKSGKKVQIVLKDLDDRKDFELPKLLVFANDTLENNVAVEKFRIGMYNVHHILICFSHFRQDQYNWFGPG